MVSAPVDSHAMRSMSDAGKQKENSLQYSIFFLEDAKRATGTFIDRSRWKATLSSTFQSDIITSYNDTRFIQVCTILVCTLE